MISLLRYACYKADIGERERGEVEAFGKGHRGFELCFVSLQRFVMQCIAETDNNAMIDGLLVEKAIQNRPWDSLPKLNASEGRKHLQRRLRGLVEALLKDC